MFLLLSLKMFDGSVKHNVILHDILTYSRHKFICVTYEEGTDTEIGRMIDWFENQNRDIEKEWKLLFDEFTSKNSAHRMGVAVKVCPDVVANNFDGREYTIKLDNVNAFLLKPKRIIVENSRGDRNFLLAIADKGLRERIFTLQTQGGLTFEHCGGIDGVASRLTHEFIPETGSEIKCWVLIDSDSTYAGHISDAATKVISLCEKANIQYLCLKKRAIENYIPNEVLEEFLDTDEKKISEALAALNTLSEEQRNHYHMSNGFKNNTCKKESDLYKGLAVQEIRRLSKGFGGAIKHVYPDDIIDLQAIHEKFDEMPDEFIAPLKYVTEMIRG